MRTTKSLRNQFGLNKPDCNMEKVKIKIKPVKNDEYPGYVDIFCPWSETEAGCDTVFTEVDDPINILFARTNMAAHIIVSHREPEE